MQRTPENGGGWRPPSLHLALAMGESQLMSPERLEPPPPALQTGLRPRRFSQSARSVASSS